MSTNANITSKLKPGDTRISWNEEYNSWLAEQWRGYSWLYRSHAKAEKEIKHWIEFIWDQGLIDTRATD